MANQNPNYVVEDDDDDDDDKGGWSFVGYSVVFFALSGLAYWWINKKEQEGGRFKLWWVLALVYHWLGKVGVSGVLAGIGVLSLLIGVIRIVAKSRQSAKA